MAWNEPGKPGQDPWGGNNNPNDNNRPTGSNRPNNSKQEPDLEEMIRKVQNFFGGSGSGGGDRDGISKKAILVIISIAVIIWLLSGLYQVDSPERAAEKRFGAFVEVKTAGLQWHIPWPIESVTIVNVDRIRTIEIGYRTEDGNRIGVVPSESLMLTKDENIVDIKIAVQYQISDIGKYLFAISDPDVTLKALTESSLREIVGQNTMDFILTEGRDEIVTRVRTLTQKKLDAYNAGLIVTSLNLQDAQPPEQVQGAFADVVKAREDRERLINEAEAYANDIIPKARGQAARQLEEARAYYAAVIATATGEASRFKSILFEYEKAPEVTRSRLYIDAITQVLSVTSTIFLNAESGTNLLYLPLDKMIGQQSAVPFAPPASAPVTTNIPSRTAGAQGGNIRDFLSNRELR